MKRLLSIANLMLCTAMIYLCVNLFYEIVAAKLDSGTVYLYSGPKMVHMEIEKPLPISAYQAFADRNLFRLPAAIATPLKKKKKSVAVEALNQTALKLKLWGTVTGDTDKAYAVIEDGIKKKQNLYRAGDTIQDAVVKLVLREKVVLHVNGKDEILAMEKMQSSRSPKRSERAPSVARRRSTQKRILKRSDLEVAFQDANAIMKQARIRPYFKDGKPGGLLLTGIKPNSIFRKMGLRNGDVILGVDEDDLKSVDDAVKLYENLKTSSSATIQLRRRGRKMTVEYTIQ